MEGWHTNLATIKRPDGSICALAKDEKNALYIADILNRLEGEITFLKQRLELAEELLQHKEPDDASSKG